MRVPLVATALLCACSFAACGQGKSEPPAPRWVELARGFRPRPLEELVAELEARVQPARPGRIVRGGAADTELWFELELPRALWSPGPAAYEWRAPLPVGGALFVGNPRSLTLEMGAKTWRRALRRKLAPAEYRDRFQLVEREISLYLEHGEPEGMLFRARLGNGSEVDGRWRVAQGELACNGLLVFPGAPETLSIEVPPASRLCFTTVVLDPGGDASAPTRFRLRLDGRTLLEHEQLFGAAPDGDWHALELGVAGPQRFTFEVEGPSPAVFAAPVLTPLAIGRADERPWPEKRPDVVLLLLDTFRADNLSAWGGEAGVAPKLDALVERSLRFLDARATAAWTLPSIGTLMTGLYPGQHGGTDLDRGIGADLETLAGVLARNGYRTAAITDAGLFSRQFGQDHGFEWFEETPVADWNLERTLAKARRRMAADDGRPLFLVVHTYRVHEPMRSGPEEDGRPWREAVARLREERKAQGLTLDAQRDPEYLRVVRGFYRDAVRDLDAKVGAWVDELAAAGFLERGVVVLTADHGNSYGEHEQIGHGGEMYDVKLRVPLALAGRDLPARAVRGVVSLIDVAPTIALLAGAEPSPTWPGRSLLAAAAPRPSYAFDLRKHHQQVALFAEGKKLMAQDVNALREGRPTHAFDLAADPGEERNLAASQTWPGELGRALATSLEPLLVPASSATLLELSPEIEQQLKAIGYGGD